MNASGLILKKFNFNCQNMLNEKSGLFDLLENELESRNSTSIVLNENSFSTGCTQIIAVPEVKVQGRSPLN